MGTVPYLSIGAYFGGMGKPRSGCSGSLESDQIETDAGGRFEVTISAKEHPGNWIALDREAHQHQLLVRQTYLDKEKDTLAEMSIERIGEGSAPALDAAVFHDRLLGVANYVKNNVDLFSGWSRDFEAHPNQALLLDVSKAQGDPNFFYFQGYWKLAPHEALVIELMPPECDYWNFQLNNYWLESLDYRDHRIEINNGAMRLESDGSARIVIAHKDPGHPNWIETAHHPHGTMGLRIVKGKEVPTLSQRVMKVSDVPAFSGPPHEVLPVHRADPGRPARRDRQVRGSCRFRRHHDERPPRSSAGRGIPLSLHAIGSDRSGHRHPLPGLLGGLCRPRPGDATLAIHDERLCAPHARPLHRRKGHLDGGRALG